MRENREIRSLQSKRRGEREHKVSRQFCHDFGLWVGVGKVVKRTRPNSVRICLTSPLTPLSLTSTSYSPYKEEMSRRIFSLSLFPLSFVHVYTSLISASSCCNVLVTKLNEGRSEGSCDQHCCYRVDRE